MKNLNSNKNKVPDFSNKKIMDLTEQVKNLKSDLQAIKSPASVENKSTWYFLNKY